ncbi:WW domain-binding protein 11-like isoform X1 [Oenanthe melanoleuca]|uniref:WW domain-binding protein 11-like isoform X1 n=1 Tax=Oenanthe melanoleuca TaxID=2939378 RepID=UPI0024C11B49|nr:WW domain-binding protein 11-like isoform X1 [Oenanthe melanoleuca]XP_056345761.1 WW domain-binding protein 11-like isoform X1 [Oenanthe melanoleuca]XP_056345762.1 WW domain-binding protein 11-like isoform X1 [Oenanthe melanoleuca]
MEASKRGRKSHNEIGNLQNIYLQKRWGEWPNKGLTPPRTPLAPRKGRFRPPAARSPAQGVRAGSAVCLPIHIPIHIPIHSPTGSPQHPPAGAAAAVAERLRPGARPFQPGLEGPRAPSPRAAAPGPCPGPAPVFCFRSVSSRTLNPGGVRESPAVRSECLASQRSK